MPHNWVCHNYRARALPIRRCAANRTISITGALVGEAGQPRAQFVEQRLDGTGRSPCRDACGIVELVGDLCELVTSVTFVPLGTDRPRSIAWINKTAVSAADISTIQPASIRKPLVYFLRALARTDPVGYLLACHSLFEIAA
jgi:hypothetical protein